MTDIWVCSNCHSINRQRVSRCYKCGGSRDDATSEGSSLRVEHALANRTVVQYRSAALLGILASVLILSVAGLGIILLLASLGDAAWIRDQVAVIANGGRLDDAGLARRLAPLIGPGLVRFGLSILAVFAFGAWLSRVVTNIPALGGGVPGTTPTKAFVYPLIPIWNLIKVPGMIQDVLYRVDPKSGGFFMIAFAWFGLVGSWIISTLGDWYVTFQLASASQTAQNAAEFTKDVQDSFDLQVAIEIVTTVLVAIGAVLLVVIMMRIERRSAARDREIRAAAGTFGEAVPAPASAGVASVAQVARFAPFAPTEPAPVAANPEPEPEPEPVVPAPEPEPEVSEPQPEPEPEVAAVEPAAEPKPEPEPEAEPEPVVAAAAPATNSHGPHMAVVVHADGRIIATVDAEPEQITLEELAMVADALAGAHGTASVTAADPSSEDHLTEVTRTLSDHGVPLSS